MSEVTNCGDCPLAGCYPNSHAVQVCKHPGVDVDEPWNEIETWSDTALPSWCPLRKAPLTIALKMEAP